MSSIIRLNNTSSTNIPTPSSNIINVFYNNNRLNLKNEIGDVIEVANIPDIDFQLGTVNGSILRWNDITSKWEEDLDSFVLSAGSNTGDILYWDGLEWTSSDLISLDNTLNDELVQINGVLQISTSTANEEEGQLRWNGTNFQGYDGTSWINLDSSIPAGEQTIVDGTSINNVLYWDGTNWSETSDLIINEGNDSSVFSGIIQIGTSSIGAVAGQLRWNGSNFQGYNGSFWVNLDNTGTSLSAGTAVDNTLRWDGANWSESSQFKSYQNSGLSYQHTFGLGSIPLSGAGNRFMWYSAKSALRAGQVSGTEWDDVNIGEHSVAFGQNNIASGERSTSLGRLNTVTGNNSFSVGLNNQVDGITSMAIGEQNTVSGNNSIALGELMEVTSNNSIGISLDNSAITLTTDNTFAILNGAVSLGSTTSHTDTFNQQLSQIFKLDNISTSTTLNNTHFIVIVDTGTAVTITLPSSPTTGRIYIIKDGTGSATSNNINILGNGNNIDGLSNRLIDVDYNSLKLIYNGSQWNLI